MEENVGIKIIKNIISNLFSNSAFLYLIIAIIIVGILKLFKPKIKGYIGEKTINLILNRLPEEYKILKDILIKTESGSSQIDHIVISKYGVFVLETKSYKGWIYGSEKDKKWTQNIYGNKYHFQNPLHQNYGHIQRLKELKGLENTEFISLILFSGEATLKNKIDNVTYFSNANKWIKNHKEAIYNESEVELIYKTILDNNIRDKEERKEHIKNIKEKQGGI